MSSLCLDCLKTGLKNTSCPHCGGRIVFHEELLDPKLAIAHVDADAFFASVEKMDNPELVDRPVIVGNPTGRSIVTTACYIARKFGVRSAQPMYQARLNCPEAVIVPPRHERYREVSLQIRAFMEELTPQIQTVSLDEAYLDLSGTSALHGAPPAVVLARLARRVKGEVGVTISVGLSHAKFLAKIASDLEKPRGFSIVGRSETLKFLENKPVGLIGGVGGRTQQILSEMGIRTIGDLRKAEPLKLERRVGSYARQLIEFSYGADSRRISPNEEAKSISAETTFKKDIYLAEDLEREVWPLCEKVSARAKKSEVLGSTVTLKLKQHNHRVVTRQMHLDEGTQLAEDLFRCAKDLIKKAPKDSLFRLIGIGLSGLDDATGSIVQQNLFDDGSGKREAVERALDQVRARWGDKAAFKGRSLK